MGYQIKDVIEQMEELAPPGLAEAWDNTGLLVGSSSAAVQRIMVTLDVTRETVREASAQQVDLIVCHHPVIFKPLGTISDQTWEGSLIVSLLSAGISVYCAHTNLDKAPGGVDDTLAESLGLQEVRPLTWEGGPDTGRPSFGRIGMLPERQSITDYLSFVKERLQTVRIDVVGDPQRSIQRVASCAGSGGDFIQEAERAGAELYITGEMKYHDAVPLLDARISAAILGHYETEQPAMTRLIKRLQNKLDALQYKIEVIPSKYYGNPYCRLKE